MAAGSGIEPSSPGAPETTPPLRCPDRQLLTKHERCPDVGHRDILTVCEYDRYSLGLALEEDMGDGECGDMGCVRPRAGRAWRLLHTC